MMACAVVMWSRAATASAAGNDFFSYVRGSVGATVQSVTETSQARVLAITYPSPVQTSVPQNNTVYG